MNKVEGTLLIPKFGEMEFQWIEAKHVFLCTKDETPFTYRGNGGHHVSIHLYQQPDGSWNNKSGCHVSIHLYQQLDGSWNNHKSGCYVSKHITPNGHKYICRAIAAAWKEFAKINPDLQNLAQIYNLEDEIDRKNNEISKHQSDIDTLVQEREEFENELKKLKK